jgi:hypothetical protein
MGDRANFAFVQPNGDSIVLYGHWAGHNMLANLAEACAKAQPRWGDPSYATRIAISQMIGMDWSSETGWGLSVNEIADNEHKIAVVDFRQRTFSLHAEDEYSNKDNKIRGMSNEPIFTQDLTNFCEKYSDSPLLASV